MEYIKTYENFSYNEKISVKQEDINKAFGVRYYSEYTL